MKISIMGNVFDLIDSFYVYSFHIYQHIYIYDFITFIDESWWHGIYNKKSVVLRITLKWRPFENENKSTYNINRCIYMRLERKKDSTREKKSLEREGTKRSMLHSWWEMSGVHVYQAELSGWWTTAAAPGLQQRLGVRWLHNQKQGKFW